MSHLTFKNKVVFACLTLGITFGLLVVGAPVMLAIIPFAAASYYLLCLVLIGRLAIEFSRTDQGKLATLSAIIGRQALIWGVTICLVLAANFVWASRAIPGGVIGLFLCFATIYCLCFWILHRQRIDSRLSHH